MAQFLPEVGHAAHVLDYAQAIQLWLGYSAKTSTDLAATKGTNPREVDVSGTDYFYAGTAKTFTADTITIDQGGSNPRKDLICIDNTNALTVIKGTSAAADPSGLTGSDLFDAWEPSPPAMSSLDVVPVAEVAVDAGATDFTASEIRDRRFILADFTAVLQTLEVVGAINAGGALDVGGDITDGANTIWDTSLDQIISHAADHQDGGADEIDVTGLSGDLADAQDPKAHDHSGDTLDPAAVTNQDYSEAVGSASVTGATTIDLTAANVHEHTLTGNVSYTFSGETGGSHPGNSFTLIVQQDGTGGHTITWPTEVQWASGTAPSLSTGANDKHMLGFVSSDGGTTWIGIPTAQEIS